MALGVSGPSSVSSSAGLGPSLRPIDGLERQGATLRANLGGSEARATAVMRFVDGRIGLSMSAGGTLDASSRGYVFDALVAAAYGRQPDADVLQLIASDPTLRAARAEFVRARAGQEVMVAIPVA